MTARLEELRRPEQQCVQPPGLGAPGKALGPCCGRPAEACWPQRRPSLRLGGLIPGGSPADLGAPLSSGAAGVVSVPVLRPQWAPSQRLPAGVQGEGQLSRPCHSPGGGRPLPSTPALPPEGRAGAVWWLRCHSGSGCRSSRCRGAAGGGLSEGRVGGWTGREDGRAG